MDTPSIKDKILLYHRAARYYSSRKNSQCFHQEKNFIMCYIVIVFIMGPTPYLLNIQISPTENNPLDSMHIYGILCTFFLCR